MLTEAGVSAKREGAQTNGPADNVYLGGCLVTLLRTQAETLGDRVAYAWLADDLGVSQSLTFRELHAVAMRRAGGLLRQCAPGDRVLLASDNSLESVVLFWACICAGLVPIPAPSPDNARSRHDLIRLRNIVRDAGVTQAWTLPRHIDAARAQVPELQWHVMDMAHDLAEPLSGGGAQPVFAADTLAYLQYTSGSTSQPRGVEITHGHALAQARALPPVRAAEAANACSLVWLPWFHDYGLVHGLLYPMLWGITSYLMSTVRFLLNPLRWLEAIDRYRITHSGGPNFAYAACVSALARKPAWSARLDSWSLATCGAEPVRPATLQAFVNAFGPFGFDRSALAPSYGLAESVLGVTMLLEHRAPTTLWIDADQIEQGRVAEVAPDHPGARALTGCGPALPGFELRIVNPETCRLCDPHEVGEIWVAGPSVARGYWAQPEATRASFGWSVQDVPDARPRFLRTGDLGFVARGELFVAGRRKDLILVNGRNLYPQDLELTAQEAHEAVRNGGVIAIAVESAASETVVLLVECQGRPGDEQVRALTDAVSQRMAQEHEIGVREVVALRSGSLPRTSSGKPMRSHARQMYLHGEFNDRRVGVAAPAVAAVAPVVDASLQAQVAALWCEVLGTQTARPEDDFLDQGGDSLMATQLVSRIAIRLGLDVSIGTVFEVRRFGALVDRLAAARPVEPGAHAAPGADTPSATGGSGHALSFSQERMWFMHQMAPESSAYNIPLAIRLRGRVDADAMRRALQQTVQRHDILRTTFVATENGVEGRVVPHLDLALADVSLHPDSQGLESYLTGLSQRPFDLARGPLLRAELIHLADDDAVLAVVMHHLVSDQWSCAILAREMGLGYSAALGQPVPALPALAQQYADYARWHRQWFDGFQRERELAYWSERLAGLEPLSLNEDHPRPPQPSYRGASLRLAYDKAAFAALAQVGARHGASLSMVLMAALNVLLWRHSGRDDVAIGVPIANRNQLASEHLIGTFVNTLVLRTDLAGDPSFIDVLEQVRDRSLDAFAHQDMPFEVLVRELDVRHDPSRAPLFNVMFNMVNAPTRDIAFHGLAWSRVGFDRRATQFDLSVLADPQHEGSIVFEYATDLFEQATIERMAGHLQAILQAALHTPARPLRSLTLLDAQERALLDGWAHGPVLDIAVPNVGAWLAAGRERSAHGPALIAADRLVSHDELHRQADDLGQRLRRNGMGPGVHVGVCMPRTADLVVALLALLKTGAAYVPLDPSYPPDRLGYQVDDAGIALLLVTRATADLGRLLFQGPVWVLDDEAGMPDLAAAATASPWREPGLADPAYLIYTSGSTGRPKGVVVPHGAMLNFLTSMAAEPGLAAGDRLLAVTTVSFDIAVLELFLPLGRGATTVLATEEQAKDGRELAALIGRHGVNVMQATPARWHLLLDAGWQGHAGFKALVGGEPLDRALAQQLQARCGQVWNMYGPTETTVWSTCWRVDAQAPSGMSLGRPIANTTVLVMDALLQPCPIGVMGEICIGGQGLALGYHQRPDLTAERFVTLPPGAGGEPVRLYRTGDFGRWRADGSLEHGGRMDDQVKLRGYRIELGEIEARLATLDGVQRAVVALKDVPGSGQTLVAYLVAQAPAPGLDALRRHLQPWLPEHMIPSRCVAIDTVPLLANGKTNRKALPMPALQDADSRSVELPRDHAEQLVWDAWSEVLGTRQIGVHDGFFDVGGHSLLAVRLAAKLERSLGRPVPLGMIFTHTTIARFAAHLVDGGEVPDLPVAVLQPQGEGTPLFLLAGADMYRALSRELAPMVPVYGLFSSTEIGLLKLSPEDPMPEISVRSLAQEYVALVQSVQPEGPYLLGGFSIGGVIAHEVTRLLQARGQVVQLLVMLDCALPGRSLGHLVKGVRRRMRQLQEQGWADFARAWRVLRQEGQARHEPGRRRIEAYARAIRQHDVPERLANTEVVFLQAGDDPSTEVAYGWPALVPGLQVERVPGKHMDILDPPHVAVLAARLRPHLERVRGKRTP